MSSSTLTYAQGFKDWLAYCQNTLSKHDFKSAKNFSRAFQMWFDKAVGPGGNVLKDTIDASWLFDSVQSFANDFELGADPILERLDPESKTKRIGRNYRCLVQYLHEQKVIDDNDLEQSIKGSTLLEDDLQRLQRASWVLRQNDVTRTFGRTVGNEFHPVSTEERRAILNRENGEDQTYEVMHVGENFILGDKCKDIDLDDADATFPFPCAVSSPENPVKIRLPASACKYLKLGDCLDATFEKAKDGDYWIIQMFTGVDSGKDKFEQNELAWSIPNSGNSTDEGLSKGVSLLNIQDQEGKVRPSYAEMVETIRSTAEYQGRMKELLKTAPPTDPLFPEEMFTEDWFEKREHDIGSDEEVGTKWDSSEDGDD